MRRIAVPTAAVTVVLVAGSFPCGAGDPSSSTADVAVLSAGLADFTFDLHRSLADGREDTVWSPFGVAITLGMVRCGSAGETDAGLAEALRCPLDSKRFHAAFRSLRDEVTVALKSGGARLAVGKLVVGQRGMVPRRDFVDDLEANYAGVWRTADFGSDSDVAALNDWVRQTTRGRVAKVFRRDPEIRMTVTGIFCMQADWREAFPVAHTEPRRFHRSDASTIQVSTMFEESRCADLATADGVELARLPYGQGGLHMLVAMPKEADGLRSLENTLNGRVWYTWMTALSRAAPVIAHVYLPKFRIEEKHDLRDPLSRMGASDVFSLEKADLRWMSDEKPGVCLNALLQHAGIITDEKGSEAWSVTHGEFISMGGPREDRPVREFRADRPFLFFVYGGVRNTVLFMGRVTFSPPVAR